MRTIERTSRFKRDYKRESRGRHRTYLDAVLTPVVETLASDRPLGMIKQCNQDPGVLDMANHFVQPRIDKAAQEEAGVLLAAIGPTVSGPSRLLRKARRYPREKLIRRLLSSLAVVPILALTGCNDPVRPSP